MDSAKDLFVLNRQTPFVIVDTGPLIHLVGCGAIHDLHKVCDRIVVPDLVAIEATFRGKAFSEEVQSCIDSGLIHVEHTATGEMYRAALKGDSNFRAKDAGERAIIDWLLDTLDGAATPAIVVYENGKVPRLIEHHDVNATISVLTTRRLITLMFEQKMTTIAWDDLLAAFPTVNTKIAESHTYFSG